MIEKRGTYELPERPEGLDTMAALNMSFKHGQTWEAARANFEKGITEAGRKFSAFIKAVEWSDDKTSARLAGTGFDVLLKVDPEQVHATGQVPLFAKMMMETPVRKFLEETFKNPKPIG